MNAGPLDSLPLWVLCLATIAVGFLSVEAGYRLGRLRRLHSEPEKESSVGVMVAATLGLLAFTLAFTFGLAWGRFDARRQLVLDEANAIRTSYLRSAFLPEPQRSTIRVLLREYLDSRLEAAQPDKAQQAVVASQRLHARLWERTEFRPQWTFYRVAQRSHRPARETGSNSLKEPRSWRHLGDTLLRGESCYGWNRLSRGTEQSPEVSGRGGACSDVLGSYVSHRGSRTTSRRLA